MSLCLSISGLLILIDREEAQLIGVGVAGNDVKVVTNVLLLQVLLCQVLEVAVIVNTKVK